MMSPLGNPSGPVAPSSMASSQEYAGSNLDQMWDLLGVQSSESSMTGAPEDAFEFAVFQKIGSGYYSVF